MGFFSKIFKGVKKVFKSIGKRIKKIAKGVGKFMGKIGIVGQIAMSFILPGIGGALLKTLGGTLGKVAAWAAAPGGNALIQGAKAVIGTATKFVTQTARAFNTVTSGVKNFLGETIKTAVNKIPGITVEGAADSFLMGKDGFFGADTAFGKAAGATANTWNTTIGSSKWMEQFNPLSKSTATSYAADIPSKQLEVTQLPETDFTKDQLARSAESFPANMGEGPLTRQPLADSYDYSMEVTGQSIELPAPPSSTSLLEKGTQVTIPEIKMPEVPTDPEIKKASFFSLSGEEAITGATQALEAFTAPAETGFGGQSAYGASPMLLGQYEVEEAAPLPQFGFPMYQFDIAQPGDAYYRPLSSWKRSMGVA